MPEKLQTQNVLIDMPPTPATHPTEQEWVAMLSALDALNRRTAALADLVRELYRQAGTHPTRDQVTALTRDVAAIRTQLEQAGRPKERRFSLGLPKLDLPRLSPALLLIPVIALVLWAAWSSWGTLWSAISSLLP